MIPIRFSANFMLNRIDYYLDLPNIRSEIWR